VSYPRLFDLSENKGVTVREMCLLGWGTEGVRGGGGGDYLRRRKGWWGSVWRGCLTLFCR